MKRKIYIRSSVFFWQSDSNIFFYDTESTSYLLLPLTDEIKDICSTINKPTSLYSFVYDDSIENENVSEFVQCLLSKNFCVDIENEKKGDFISLPPILGINNNWEIIKNSGKTRNIIELLRSIVFFIGGSVIYNIFDNLSRLCNINYNLKPNALLDLNVFEAFLSNNRLHHLSNLSFVIEENCSSEYLNNLLGILCEYNLEKITRFYILINSFDPNIPQLSHSSFQPVSAIFTNPPYPNSIKLQESMFLVQSKDDIVNAIEYINENKLQNYTLYPSYNGKNLNFFEENVFPSIEEILREKISKRHIFIHQTLNIKYFGRLIVLPNMHVYSTPFKPNIGNLSDGIYSLVYSEMENNYIWRKTRADLTQCHDCLYRDLCPSPILEEELMQHKCPNIVI